MISNQVHQPEKCEYTDRDVLRYVLLIIASLLPSCLMLTLRPMHNDEAVNHYFIEQLQSLGYYPYSHENYHGPIYFYILYGFVRIFGEGVSVLRVPSVVFTALSLAMLWNFRKTLGGLRVCFLATFLIGFSPSLFYYRRYAIHETLFAFAGMFLGLAMLQWILQQTESRQARYSLFIGSVALAVLITTKETWIITLFSVGIASTVALTPKRLLVSLWKEREQFVLPLFLCSIVVCIVFSGFFLWANGLREMLLAIPQWVSRNDSDVGHHKPFQYYFSILLREEPIVVVSMILSAIALLASQTMRSDIAFRFLFTWVLTSFLVYSFVQYKTPWLILNITLPGLLLFSLLVTKIINKVSLRRLAILLLAGCTLLTYQLYRLHLQNIVQPAKQENPFAYVHTEMDVYAMIELIKHKSSSDSRILVGISQHWPLPYYLREFGRTGRTAYLANAEFGAYKNDYDIMILDPRKQKDNATPPKGWSKRSFTFSHVQPAEVWWKESHPATH